MVNDADTPGDSRDAFAEWNRERKQVLDRFLEGEVWDEMQYLLEEDPEKEVYRDISAVVHSRQNGAYRSRLQEHVFGRWGFIPYREHLAPYLAEELDRSENDINERLDDLVDAGVLTTILDIERLMNEDVEPDAAEYYVMESVPASYVQFYVLPDQASND